MEAELAALTAALESPARPVLALVGGAKVSTKLDLLRFVIGKVDVLAIGGAMANTLLFAEGTEVGRSLCEREMADNARKLLALARERNCRVILPEDAVVAARLAPGDRDPHHSGRCGAGGYDDPRHRPEDRCPHRGPHSERRAPLSGTARSAPLRRRLSTRPPTAVAKKVAELTRAGKLLSVAGGGDTVAALAVAGVTDQLSYVSTAGGAFLEWLEGRELPGVAAARRSRSNRPDGRRRMKASDVMTRTVLSVRPDETIVEAIRTDARQPDQRSAGDRRGRPAGRDFDRGRPVAPRRNGDRAASPALARDPDGAGPVGGGIRSNPRAQDRRGHDPRPGQRHPGHAAQRNRGADGTPPHQAGAGTRRRCAGRHPQPRRPAARSRRCARRDAGCGGQRRRDPRAHPCRTRESRLGAA